MNLKVLATSFLLFGLLGQSLSLVQGPWSTLKTPEDRAKALLNNMTLDEKILMLHGPVSKPWAQCKNSSRCAYVGNVAPNTRLGIPPINMNDGPQGFRDNNNPQTTTAWTSGLTMAASFDVDAMYEWGVGMGKEFYEKGANVQLGPGLCLARVPRNGRNFEYLSGEDPFLGYTLVQPVIKGIQSQKVVANAKHYILNNQETNRHAVSEEADERTRFEMYYPAFEGAVAADVGSVMCSYNKIYGVWSCENPITLAHDLKVKTGFKGYVMSDWGATHSTSIMAGLDIEMPGAGHMNPEKIKAGLAAKNITQAAIDDSVFRILRAMFSVGVMDEPEETWNWKKLSRNVTTDESVKSARKLSAASTVLVKNTDGVLPLQDGKKVAMIGFVGSGAVVHGGGSGSVVPSYVATPLDGMSAQYKGSIVSSNGTNLDEAVELARASDYALVFVGTLSHEGGDRVSLSLDDGCKVDEKSDQCKGNADNQNEMIERIAGVNKNTIVVASVPGAITMPWSGSVAGILINFMPGQQAGHAITDVLLGKVNPTARLPITMPNKENETNFAPEQWPGLPDPAIPEYANYTERLLVGYRYYDHHGIKFSTGFPFGHGLSYTSFSYSNLEVDSASRKVSFDVENAGSVAGADIPQLYLGFPSDSGEPPLQLKGFQKTKMLEPKEKIKVTFTLGDRDLSIWDVDSHNWKVQKGTFALNIGRSSRDIRLHDTMNI